MNTGTLIASLVMAALLALLIGFLIRQMMRGWLNRAERQAEAIGTSATPTGHRWARCHSGNQGPLCRQHDRRLRFSERLRPEWLDRVVVGDLGFRTKAVLTRYPEGIMVQRIGASPIWIPDESITAIRTERGLAGKALTHDGILAIRWRLPSGTEIDTGFRGDDRTQLANWLRRTRRDRGREEQEHHQQREAERIAHDRTALFVLEDGRVFTGTTFGAVGQTLGEAVFSTGMSGYQETLTDPSYHGQIVVATAPQIGNTGWNHEDAESRGDKIWVAGYAVRDPSPRASNWRATGTLDDELVRQGIVGIAGIDTRAVVRHLRSSGSMKAGVFSGSALADLDELSARVRSQPSMLGADLAGAVSTDATYVVEPIGSQRFTVAALDLGIKTNTPRNFANRGIRTHVLPSYATFDQLAELKPDGVFLSNGPGDPATADHVVAVTREVLGAGIPLFGICFGNQLLGRALGRSTYKMVFGHRGINVPVMDHATGRVAITAQNHGFALEGEAGEEFDTPFGRAVVSHTCANDGVVEGIKLVDGRAFSVQYHPEAAAGPHDAEYLFDQFVDLMSDKAGEK